MLSDASLGPAPLKDCTSPSSNLAWTRQPPTSQGAVPGRSPPKRSTRLRAAGGGTGPGAIRPGRGTRERLRSRTWCRPVALSCCASRRGSRYRSSCRRSRALTMALAADGLAGSASRCEEPPPPCRPAPEQQRAGLDTPSSRRRRRRHRNRFPQGHRPEPAIATRSPPASMRLVSPYARSRPHCNPGPGEAPHCTARAPTAPPGLSGKRGCRTARRCIHPSETPMYTMPSRSLPMGGLSSSMATPRP